MESLKAAITHLRQEQDQSLPESARNILRRSVQRVTESGLADSALGVGDRFPQFSLPNAGGDAISTEELLAQGPLVVCFFRGHWCPYCDLELRAYQALLPEILKRGASLVAISPQLPEESLHAAVKAKLGFEMLSDNGNSLASHLGLVHELEPRMKDLYRSLGYDLERINGNMRWTLPLPATYVVGPDGIVAEAFVQADYSVRLEPVQVLAILEKLNSAN
jgi:peroxiredoxin